MRIIAGTHRARPLLSPESRSVRPTSDKLRGAIFNILEHSPFVPPLFREDQAVLDICCGTGALAFEALSRGFGKALLADNTPANLALARRNAVALGMMAPCNFAIMDAAQLPDAPQAFDLVFLDPPYKHHIIDECLPLLLSHGWLAPQAIIVAETQRNEQFALPPGFVAQDRRSYGDSAITFLLRVAA